MSSVHQPHLVWLGEVPWRGLPQRHQHLVRGLAQRWAILFLEPPPPMQLPRRAITSLDGIRVAQVAPVLNARQPVLQRLLSPAPVRAAAQALASVQVRRAVRSTWPRRPLNELTAVCSNVYLAHAAHALRPARLVLDLCDDTREFPGVPPWTRDVFGRAVVSADCVTTSSRSLETEVRVLRSDGCVHYIPNGVRGELVSSSAKSGSAIGYLGYLGPWLDLALLERLADALPDRQLQLIGPVDPTMARSLDRLRRRPNVCIDGPIAEEAVPRTLARFSVGIIPFRLTPLTRAVNPNKLYEYAAFDLPIVATPFSPDLDQFSPSIDLCADPQAFIDTVRAHANRSGVGARSTRWIAESHTWDAIAHHFATLLEPGGC